MEPILFDWSRRPPTVLHEGRHYRATGRVQGFDAKLWPGARVVYRGEEYDVTEVGPTTARIRQSYPGAKSISAPLAEIQIAAGPQGGAVVPVPRYAALAEYACFADGSDHRIWADERGVCMGLFPGSRVRYRLEGRDYAGSVLIVGIDEHLIRRDGGGDDLVPARNVGEMARFAKDEAGSEIRQGDTVTDDRGARLRVVEVQGEWLYVKDERDQHSRVLGIDVRKAH